MLLTPVLTAAGPRLAKIASRTWLKRFDHRRFNSAATQGAHSFEDHIVIAGFGITGRAIARAAKKGGVPYVVVEMDSLIVRDALDQGEPVFYGDVTQEPIAQHVGVDKARVVVITINSARAARRATELAKRLAPAAHVLVRTRHPREITHLLALGADDVVTDEVEVSVETLARTLEYFEVSPAVIEDATDQERQRYEWEITYEA